MVDIIIGLVGKKGSGKTTTSEHLVSEYGFIEVKFASLLHDVVKALFRLTDEQLNDPLLKETKDEKWNETPRKLMQTIGDLVRFDLPKKLPEMNDLFIKAAKDKIQNLMKDQKQNKSQNLKIVVSDCRTKQEWQFLKKECKADMVRISRSNCNNNNIVDNHSTETDLDDYCTDFTLENDSTIDDLHMKIFYMMQNFK